MTIAARSSDPRDFHQYFTEHPYERRRGDGHGLAGLHLVEGGYDVQFFATFTSATSVERLSSMAPL